MIHRLIPTVALLFFGVPAVEAQTPAPKAIDARAQFQACTTCHGRPDPALESGILWIGQVAETACVQPVGPKSAALRSALRTYLLGEREVPSREEKAREAGPGEGRVVLAHPEAIALLLVPEGEGSPVRLIWKADEGSEARTLPVGTYRIRHYAVTRRDRQDVEWQLWGSGAKGRRVSVKSATEPTEIRFDPRVRLATSAAWTDHGLQVGLAPTGDSKMGITIMKAGKRIAAKYRVLGADGVTAKGTMNYG